MVMTKSAEFSFTRVYRYKLERIWDADKATCLFIMLNPSTADENVNDRTVAKCIKYASNWGCGRLLVGNIFAYRATDPKRLKKVHDPVGRGNDEALLSLMSEADLIVCAWGRHGNILGRQDEVEILLRGQETLCLDHNKDGSPVHPLYQKGNLKPMPWRIDG